MQCKSLAHTPLNGVRNFGLVAQRPIGPRPEMPHTRESAKNKQLHLTDKGLGVGFFAAQTLRNQAMYKTCACRQFLGRGDLTQEPRPESHFFQRGGPKWTEMVFVQVRQ